MTSKQFLIPALLFTILLIIIINLGDKLNFLFFDDSFYYLDMVQTGNLLNPTTDGVNHTTGYHPLWYWFLEFLSLFFNKVTITFSIIGAIICLFASYFVWLNFFKKITNDPNYSIILSLFLHFFPSALLMTLSGMETAMVVLVFGIFINSYHNVQWFSKLNAGHSKFKIYIFVFSCILLFLARTDTFLFSIPCIIYLLYTDYKYIGILSGSIKEKFTKLLPLILYGSGIVIYLVYNKIVSGSFFQTSAIAYTMIKYDEALTFPILLQTYWHTIKYSTELIGDWHVHILFFIIPIILYFKRIPTYLKVLFIGLCLNFFVHDFIRLFFKNWYVEFYFILFVITLAYMNKKRAMILMSVLSILVVLQLIPSDNNFTNSNRNFKYWASHDRPADQILFYDKLQEVNYEGYVGAFNSGEFGFYRDKVINLDGLMNTEIMNYYEKEDIYPYLKDNHIFFIVDYSFYYGTFDNYMGDSVDIVGTVKSPQNLDRGTSLVMQLKCYDDIIVEREKIDEQNYSYFLKRVR